MKIKSILHLLIAVCLILLPIILAAQECPPKGNCGGDCAPWYFRNGGVPVLAGTPTCHKVKTEKVHGENNSPECHCVLLHTATMCTPQDDKFYPCDGECPDLFPTQQDAINNTNPIHGECLSQGTGQSVYCTCRYIK